MASVSDNAGLSGVGNATPDVDSAAIDDRVRAAQFAALNRQARISNLSSPLIAAIVVFVMWNEVGSGPNIIWLTAVVLATAVRGFFHYRADRALSATGAVTQSDRWAILSTIFLSGLVWGGGMPLLFPENNLTLQAFLIVAVLGMGAGATASFGPFFPALAVYVVPLAAPIIAILLWQQTVIHTAFGFFGIIFLTVLLLLGSAGHRNLIASIRLEFENAHLTAGLEHAQRRLDDAVDSMSEAFALFNSNDRLVLANERLRDLIPELNGRVSAGLSYADFFRMFADLGLAGVAPDEVDDWLEQIVRHRSASGEPFEVELADGQWLRISAEPTSDGGVVAIFSDLTQLKNREAAIEESEQRFRDFTRAASDWAWELDADLRFTSVSGRYADVSGRSPNFLIGKRMVDVPSLSQDSNWQTLRDALADKKPFHNCRLVRPDANDEPFYFLCSGIPVFADDGAFKGFRGTGSDITAIVRAEARAREAQEQLSDAIESIAAGLILFDKNERLILWNSKASQYLSADPKLIRSGTTVGEILRSSSASGNVIEANEDEAAFIANRMRWFHNPEKALEVKFADGRYIQLLGRRTRDDGLVAILTDVTAERTAAAALEESEDRYRRLVENSPDLISIHKGGRFLFINPAGARLLGLPSPAQVIGRRVLDFIHPDHHERLRLSRPTEHLSEADDAMFEFRACRDDGTEFEAEGISLEFNYGGEPAILGIVRDITVRKLAEAQLVQTSKLATLGELAAGITHELNQPLNVIRMAADSSLILMEDGKTDRDFERKQFERISDNAVRMADIIGHMGAFSRREDDDDDRRLIDPLESVAAAVSLVRDQYALRNIEIEVDVADRPSLVYGNPVRLEQVILNLLANAHDALALEKVDPETGRVFIADQAGHIRVSVRVDDAGAADAETRQKGVVIQIEDNGGGIPDKFIDHIFDPFFTTKRTGQGTGLGLAIGYNIVERMGGRITASNGPDGARFEVWLPIADQSGDNAAAAQSPSSRVAE